MSFSGGFEMILNIKDNKINAEFGLSGSEQQYFNYFKLALEKLQSYLNTAQKIQGIVHDKLDKDGVFKAVIESEEDNTKAEEPLPPLTETEQSKIESKPKKVNL